MLFNSLDFGVFLLIVLGVYYALGLSRRSGLFRIQNAMLLVASYVFYGWWDERFLFLIAASTVIDYTAGLVMDRGGMTRGQRAKASAALLLSAPAFLMVDWGAMWCGMWGGSWNEVFRVTPMSLWATGVSAAVVVLGNVAHTGVVRLSSPVRRRAMLTLSMAANLGLLGVFKYYGFFVGSMYEAIASLGLEGVDPSWLRLEVVLPVGISFYTFQTMSYTIDVYRRQLPATDRLLDFGLFVAFFPQLVAGPIERASHLLPRLMAPRRPTLEMFSRGSYLILFGLFKKIAVADGLAASVNSIYNAPPGSGVTSVDVTVATVFFAIQIYCDFSGYTDVARGVAKLMGVDLMINFDQPYFSTNPAEFWHRWHISLSTWLRDYLYIPLGGNRKGPGRTYVNLMLTMLLGGLWHGAAWNYVLWGAYQGGILCIHRKYLQMRGRSRKPASLTAAFDVQPGWGRRVAVLGYKAVMIGLFFAVTCYGWLLFRCVGIPGSGEGGVGVTVASGWHQIVDFTRLLAIGWWEPSGLGRTMKRPPLAAVAGTAFLFVYELIQYRYGDARFYRSWPTILRGFLIATMLLLLLMGTSNEPTQFIYFQF